MGNKAAVDRLDESGSASAMPVPQRTLQSGPDINEARPTLGVAELPTPALVTASRTPPRTR